MNAGIAAIVTVPIGCSRIRLSSPKRSRDECYPTKNTTDFAATILVVDDDPTVRGVFVRWLSEAGYTCVEAGCVADAWASLGQIVVPLTTLDTTFARRNPE